MDPMRNPFNPGAGTRPPELVGRDDIKEYTRILLGRVKIGKSERSILLTGLRGVGKTVLLIEMKEMAMANGYLTVSLEAHDNKSLALLLIPPLRKLLLALDRMESAKDKAKRGLAVLKGFIDAVSITIGEVEFGLHTEPEVGTADSGDLEADLPNLLEAIAEAAQERQTAIAILIDEMQYLEDSELSALIMSMHKMQQQSLPLVLLGAGLSILPGMAGESKSYAERLFHFPEIGPLTKPDSYKALQEPVKALNVEFEQDALDEIFRVTQGYPYFLQEWGHQSWNRAADSPITLQVVREATEVVTRRLDENFFRVRFGRMTPGEKLFLRAMAHLGPGPQRTGDIADTLGVPISRLSPPRSKLMKKGMIYSPSHGNVAFTVPLFDEFMKRAIADFKPVTKKAPKAKKRPRTPPI